MIYNQLWTVGYEKLKIKKKHCERHGNQITVTSTLYTISELKLPLRVSTLRITP